MFLSLKPKKPARTSMPILPSASMKRSSVEGSEGSENGSDGLVPRERSVGFRAYRA